MNIGVLLLYALLGVCQADFLADYLEGKVFGVDPGPCPEQDPDNCVLDLESANFPDSIANIEFCLIKDVIIFGDLLCQDLGDWVRSGTAQIWEIQCQDISYPLTL